LVVPSACDACRLSRELGTSSAGSHFAETINGHNLWFHACVRYRVSCGFRKVDWRADQALQARQDRPARPVSPCAGTCTRARVCVCVCVWVCVCVCLFRGIIPLVVCSKLSTKKENLILGGNLDSQACQPHFRRFSTRMVASTTRAGHCGNLRLRRGCFVCLRTRRRQVLHGVRPFCSGRMQLQAYSRLQLWLTPSRTEQLPDGTVVRILDESATLMKIGEGDVA